MSNDSLDSLSDIIMDELDRVGAATVEVSDGRLLIFRREWIEGVLEEHPDQPMISILIQKPVVN